MALAPRPRCRAVAGYVGMQLFDGASEGCADFAFGRPSSDTEDGVVGL